MSVQLHRLKLTNFRQHADTEIEFGTGITGIIGPNGAGKTTLLEAIAWAFYGAPAVRGSRDGIRWNQAAPRSPVRAEVEFGLGGHEYRVVRSLYGAELFQDRAAAPMANSAQEVTRAVHRLLGMSRDEFFNTYFTGQKELAVMAAMGATERGKFLSRILGYERLRTAQDKLREQRSALRGELAGLERLLGDPAALEREREEGEARRAAAAAAVTKAEARFTTAEARREQEGPRWTEQVRMRESILTLETDQKVAGKEVEEARRQFERLDKELADALAAQAQLKDLEPALVELEPLRAERDRLEREGRAAGRRRMLVGQLAEVSDQERRQHDRLQKLGDVAGELERAEATLAGARDEAERAERAAAAARTQWVRDKQDAETKRLALRDQYRDLQQHKDSVVAAGPSGACPTCRRPLGDEYDAVLHGLERQLQDVEMNGRFFRQRVEQLAEEPDEVGDARRRLEEAKAAVQAAADAASAARERVRDARESREDLARCTARRDELEREVAALPETYDAERHDHVVARLRELEPTVTRAAELRVKATRAEALVTEAEAAERTASQCEAKLAAVTAQIAGLGFSEDRYDEARKAYDEAQAAEREAELRLEAKRGDLKTAEAALAGVNRRLAERATHAARAREVRRELALHDELDDALGELRTDLNAQLRPELSDLASGFLADLTDGRYHELELDEQYRILVLEDGEPRPVISGGEEDVANLVLRLAISQLVAERAGQPLSLLVLDEIFGSLDEHRRQHVVGLLRRLADRFPQVVLITHIESVRDSVDRVLRVTLDASRGTAVVSDDSGDLDEGVAA